MTRQTLLVAILVPLLLLMLAAIQLMVGGNALPIWIASIAQGREQDPLTYLRVLILLEFFFAFLLIFFGRRMPIVGLLVLAGIAFISLAECSAAVRRELLGSLVFAAIIFALALVLGFAFLRARSRDKREDALPANLPPVRGFTVIAVFALIALAATLAINIPLAPRTLAEGASVRANIDRPVGNQRIIELAPETWVGLDLAETAIGRFVPDVKDILQDGRGTIVLYNPRCGSCQDLFDVYFSSGVDRPTIALLVPPSPQESVLPSEYPDTVNCQGCEFMSLPQGPLWLVQPPVVLGIEDGVIKCVARDDPTPCLEAQ